MYVLTMLTFHLTHVALCMLLKQKTVTSISLYMLLVFQFWFCHVIYYYYFWFWIFLGARWFVNLTFLLSWYYLLNASDPNCYMYFTKYSSDNLFFCLKVYRISKISLFCKHLINDYDQWMIILMQHCLQRSF